MSVTDGVIFTAEGVASTKLARIASVDKTDQPVSFAENTTKEELVMEYVENFRKQFVELFPSRKELFLTAPNECGVVKFVCTTLRATQLPFRDMYDAKFLAEFLSDSFQYEPLPEPSKPPEYLPSPSSVLGWMAGDCFDMSMVLASYLIGNGYDAYVVVGTAPKWITLRDQSRLPCPDKFHDGPPPEPDGAAKLLESKEDAAASETVPGIDKYRVADRGPPKSKFLQMLEEREAKEEEANRKPPPKLPEEPLEPLVDELAPGSRVHAWVLIRAGKREWEEHTFVEPSTGRFYAVTDSPYHTVEAVWNNTNYYVNMQTQALVPSLGGGESKMEESKGGDGIGIGGGGGGGGSGGGVTGDGFPAGLGLGADAVAAALAELKEAEGDGDGKESESKTPQGVGMLSWDFGVSADWEFVLIEPEAEKGAAEGDEGELGEGDGLGLDESMGLGMDTIGLEGQPLDGPQGAEGDGAEGEGAGGEVDDTLEEDREKILDQPPSWVPKLIVPRDAYLRRFGATGTRTTYFHRTKLESYAPLIHDDGLENRLTRFEDNARTKITTVIEEYSHRVDRLCKRVRWPLERKTAEYFLPGRPHGMRAFIEIAGVSREMEFYVAARLDGLKCRKEIIGSKITEEYEGHRKGLVYRSVKLALPLGPARGASKSPQTLLATDAGELAIHKMTEKYSRNDSVPAERDIAKITYLLDEDVIRVVYHQAAGRITAAAREYVKGGDDLDVNLTSVDPFAPVPKKSELDADYRAALTMEADCKAAVKDMQRVCGEMVRQRRNQEISISLEKTVFEIAQERSASGVGAEAEADGADDVGESKVDYLAPFLHAKDPNNPTVEEARAADTECRKAMRDRLVERLNIIQRRLDEENERLHKRQQAFQRNHGRDQSEGAEEEFEKFCSDAMFRIGILEQRLQRQEETVVSKFGELELMLKNDPRLKVLRSAKD